MLTVDVIIPAYNAAGTIEATIRSVLAQTDPPDHIIIVDDGSNDETATLAASLDPSVTVVRQSNGGQGCARRRGTTVSNADLLLFLDSDDLLQPNAIEVLTATLLSRPECSLAYCRAELFRESTNNSRTLDNLDDADGDVWTRLLRRNFIRSPGCVLMRRSALLEVGGWEPSRDSQGCEDWDLWLRLAEHGPFARVTDDLLRYRVHPSNFSGRLEAMDDSCMWVLRKHLAHQRRKAVTAAQRGHLLLAARAGFWATLMLPRSAARPITRLIKRAIYASR